MDNPFVCIFSVTKEMFFSWENVDTELPFDRVMKLGWIFLLILSVLVTLYLKKVWFLLIAALAVFRAFFSRKVLINRQYDLMAKQRSGPDWVRRLEFTDSKILMTEGKLANEIPYAQLEEILENENDVILRLRDGTLLHILADCFIRGTWTECRAFLTSKMEQ